MLSKPLLAFIDNVANDLVGSLPNFPYHTFNEIIHLNLISLLREIMQNSCGEPGLFLLIAPLTTWELGRNMALVPLFPKPVLIKARFASSRRATHHIPFSRKINNPEPSRRTQLRI